MKSKKNLLKEASILLIIILIFSSVIVTVNANTAQTIPEMSNIINHIYGEGNNRGDIVWDNGMNYDWLCWAIVDIINDFDFVEADDFIFTENTAVLGVHWVGGYVDAGYQQGDLPWFIGFYYDQGDGNAPSECIYGFEFTHMQCNPVLIEDTGYDSYIDFSVTLPETVHFQANTKYWIAILGFGEAPPTSCWTHHDTPILLNTAVYGSDAMGVPYWSPLGEDMCFQLTEAQPDLECDGSLSWTDVEPGTVVTGSFEVENIGELGSLLDWEIAEWPDWGTWIFEPDDGEDLTPEDGAISIDVTVIAPDVQNENFPGHVTITNAEDSSDFCIIDVSLATPVNQQLDMHPLFQRIFERFPNAFPILRHLHGL